MGAAGVSGLGLRFSRDLGDCFGGFSLGGFRLLLLLLFCIIGHAFFGFRSLFLLLALGFVIFLGLFIIVLLLSDGYIPNQGLVR